MLRFIGRRLLLMIPTVFIISVVGFIIIQAPPGDFVTSYVASLEAQGDLIEPELIDSLRSRYGLGEPLYVQYWKWLSNFLRGRLGYSMHMQVPVEEVIRARLPASVSISLFSLILVYAIGVPIGLLSATKQYSLADYIFTVVGFFGVAVPNFLFALVMLWLLFLASGNVAVGLFSPGMQNAPFSIAKVLDLLGHIWVPALIVGTAGTAGLIRTMRANLLDELPKPYVITARAPRRRPHQAAVQVPAAHSVQPRHQHRWLDSAGARGGRGAGIAGARSPHHRAGATEVAADAGHVSGGEHRHDPLVVDAGRNPDLGHSAGGCGSAHSGVGMSHLSLPADTLLSVRNLQTYFFSREGTVKAVDGVSFDVKHGEILGIAGESGCGKSVTSQSIMRIVPANGKIVSGQVLFNRGHETIDLATPNPDGKLIREIRGKEVSMVFQEPMTSFSPVHTIGNQIIETICIHQHVTKKGRARSHRDVAPGGDAESGAQHRPVHLQPQRRHAPACNGGDGAFVRAQIAHCRRADHRCRRDHPGADVAVDPGDSGRAGHGHHHDHP